MPRSPVIAAIGLCVLCGSPSPAGVIREDRDDALYTALASQPQFDPVGLLQISFTGGGLATCSATLIGDEWLLTAAHCVSRTDVSLIAFGAGGSFGFGSEVFVHPDWVDGAFTSGNDLALVRLASPIVDIEPARLVSGPIGQGDQLTAVGYGRTGGGIFGAQPGTEGTKRAGHNIFDQRGSFFGYDDRVLLADFDNPLDPSFSQMGATEPLDLEYSIAPGDSGGSAWVEQDGAWYVAGVASFIAAPRDLDADGSYGDVNGWTDVSAHLGWISSIVPAPATSAVLGLAFVGARRRRRATLP